MVQSHLHLPEASEIAILEQQSLLLLLQEPPRQEKREQEFPAHQRLVSKAASVQKTEEKKAQPAWRLKKKEMQGFLTQGVKTVQKATFANQVLEISLTDLKGVLINLDLEPEANQKEGSANQKHLDPEVIGPKGVSTNQDMVQAVNRMEDSANQSLVILAKELKGVSTNQNMVPAVNQMEDSANRKHLDPEAIGQKGVLINQDMVLAVIQKEDSANQSLVILAKEENSARMDPVKKTRAGDLEKIPDQGHLTEIKNLLATVAMQGPVSKKVRLEAVLLPLKTDLEFRRQNK